MSALRNPRRRDLTDPSATPTLDEFADLLDEKLASNLGPIRSEVAQTKNKLGLVDEVLNNQGDEMEEHHERIKKLENRVNLLSGDGLGGEPVRLLIALVAFVIGGFASWLLNADGWKLIWFGLAWAFIAYGVVQMVQIKRAERSTSSTTSDNPGVHSKSTPANS